jgi:hypothetical protein
MTGSADGDELATLSLATADTDLAPRAREILNRWARGPAPRWADIAMYATLIGDHEMAVDAIERAWASRSPLMAQLRVAAWLDPIRDDPRFIEILRRMAFP